MTNFNIGDRVVLRQTSRNHGSDVTDVAAFHGVRVGDAGAVTKTYDDCDNIDVEWDSNARTAKTWSTTWFDHEADAAVTDAPEAAPTFAPGDNVDVETLRTTANMVVTRPSSLGDPRQWLTHGDGTMTRLAKPGSPFPDEQRLGIAEEHPDCPGDNWVECGWKFVEMRVERARPASADLSDRGRRALPAEEAYPVGSVWNHISMKGVPVTIVEHLDDDRILVDFPNQPGHGDNKKWPRAALDALGTFVGWTDEAPTAPTIAPRNPAVVFRSDLDEALAALEHQKQRVVDLETELVSERARFETELADEREKLEALRLERATLTQAASDERRRLCEEIDDLRAQLATRAEGFESAQASAHDGWNEVDRLVKVLDYANGLLDDAGRARLEGFVDGTTA